MKNLFKFLTLLFSLSLVLLNCSENENSQDDGPNNEDPEVSILCDGNDSGSYWPLALGNQWVYEGPSFSNLTLNLDISEIVEISGNDYFKVEPSGTLAFESIYLRVDEDGNIYQHSAPSSEDDAEVLYLPANPTLNQEWSSFGSCAVGPCAYYKKVESLDATVETDDCTYENCLAIREYTVLNNGDEIDGGLIFYKEGVGYLGADGFSSSLELIEITLN